MIQGRRRFTRWQINRDVKIKLGGAEKFANCKINDISFMGLNISLPLKLPKDTFLKLSLLLSDEFVFDIEAWVVWHKAIDGHNIYGFYFTRIKDHDKERIYQFMRQYFPEQIDKKWFADLPEEKGGEKMQDRRIFARFKAEVPLRYISPHHAKEGQAYIYDVSAKGLGVVTDEELAPAAPLELWLKIGDKEEPLYTRGEVIWSKRLEPNKYRVGINLEKADLMGLSRILRTG